MIELEKTYLAKFLPEGVKNSPSKEVVDIYIPQSSPHPKLRIRKNGDSYEMTKKEPLEVGDNSRQDEQTIILTETEFNELAKLEGKRTRKTRYYYDYQGVATEVDVFQDSLYGLVLVDIEFKTEEEKNSFPMPDFCLVDLADEDFIAGGMLCGKSYADIKEDLRRFNYSKII
ncbi:MAG: hypothetical protein HY454_01035 [Parcubacteria group bacterium]|nr:hypothetical protein [Parcubacteria group bacterium]